MKNGHHRNGHGRARRKANGAAWKSRAKSHQLDLALAVCHAITPPGYEWKLQDLASVCGVSHQAIHSIEMQALRKLRAKLSREAPDIFGMLSRI
jgi:hypothetical protein